MGKDYAQPEDRSMRRWAVYLDPFDRQLPIIPKPTSNTVIVPAPQGVAAGGYHDAAEAALSVAW